MSEANAHAGHRSRIRKRLITSGLGGFQEHEVLEWMLFCTIPRGDVNVLAHRLLNTFGGLSGVLRADYYQLVAVEGVGEATALFLSNYLSVYGRYLESRRRKENPHNRLQTTQQLGDFFHNRFLDKRTEVLYALLLDANDSYMRDFVVTEGSLERVNVDFRVLTEACLNAKCAKVVLAHNHPSGFLLPSAQDEITTRQVSSLLASLKLRLVDHLIVGEEDFVSMAEDERYSYLFF